ncbi:hypothetical protein ACFMBG_18375 [Leisingera sp. D0M16]|uniref:hypothetical protein n=1 Tax=Leisingera coralii TaxID=3351347 RepID=UPI003B78C967
MKIAIIGNSHCGAWRRAWEKLASQFPSIDLTFFAARGGMINALSLKDQCLVPHTESLREVIKYTSGGFEKIDPALFDLFLVCGLQKQVVASYDRPEYSQGVYNRMVLDQFQASPAHQVLKKLRAITSKPIYFTPAPLRAYPPKKRPLARSTYEDQTVLLQETFLTPLETIIFPQPHETIVDEVATDPRFSQNSSRLETGRSNNDGSLHRDNDIIHMNASFGELALRAFLDRVRLVPSGTLT